MENKVRKSRAKTLNLHEWTKNDTILCLYFTKYGTSNLYLKSEATIADFIGTSVGSLKMQSANMRALMGQTDHVLSDYSQLQKDVYNEFGGLSQYELLKLVKTIINQDEHERNEILRKLGKDPAKLKKV